MKDIVIYLHLNGHLRQWLIHALGNPVRFPARSYENLLMVRHLKRKTDRTECPTNQSTETVAICLPDNSMHRPEYYNHLTQRGIRLLSVSIDNLFRMHLWSDCSPLVGSSGELNRGIDAWCAANGISLEYREAVRQKFYRMRRLYETNGIIVKKKRENRIHYTPHFCTHLF